MTAARLDELRHLRRARDLMDRDYAKPLDVATIAEAALMSPAHFTRRFRAAYSESPYGYLMTRRIERAQELLRAGASVTEACVSVGFASLGSFSSRFTEITGMTPSRYREQDHGDLEAVPPCVARIQLRPRRVRASSAIGEAGGAAAP
ncbi:MAG: helix-turn-helix transcriptional regulator [Thermoleophilia bacterium]